MTPIEKSIRQTLGVADNASSVVILGMDAHMDWDWLNTFQTLVFQGNQSYGQINRAVQLIIDQAWSLMNANQQAGNTYRYSVCEMGFLRAGLDLKPELIDQFKQNGLDKQLSIEGGGITSPDNLLPHGEAFIRNYLVGMAWQSSVLGLPSTFAYLPDDFGHDAQLPVMIEAMGFEGVSFSRIPGSWASSQTTPLNGDPSLWQQLMDDGADLFWEASDGSSALAHLEQHGYCQGNGPLSSTCGDPAAGVAALKSLLAANQPSSPSPYVYIPCGCDFALPIPCLLDIANAWNQQSPAPSTTAVVGTLEQYLQLVQSWSESNPSGLVSRAMAPTPYWTGFYASRPANKILHQSTVRALLGAEVISKVADLLQTSDSLAWVPVRTARQKALKEGWESLLPSTHHDYITGTAVDSVYTEEQRPLLLAAEQIALGARSTSIQSIAPMIGASPQPGEKPIAVFNQHGFDVTGLVEVETPPGMEVASVRSDSNTSVPVQSTRDGKLLFVASAPSMGYRTCYLSPATATEPSPVSIVVATDGSSVTMSNTQLSVTMSKSSGWAISSLQPLVNGVAQPNLVPSGSAANALTFYEDKGNIYNFGNELDPNGFSPISGQMTSSDAMVIESGPLRATFKAQITFSDGVSTGRYEVIYSLVVDEPMVRIEMIGSVPLPPDPSNPPSGVKPYAVAVRFPFANGGTSPASVDGMVRGTPYHWDQQLPEAYWAAPTFQAIHDFLVPSVGGVFQGAIYHSDIPAWAIDEDGAMIGCILRNTPSVYPWPVALEGRGANGTDFGTHSHRYALRIPQGLNVAQSTLDALKESVSLATPLHASPAFVPHAGVDYSHPVTVSFPAALSLATVVGDNAILTVAKAGQQNPESLILRLYQASNTTQTVTVSLAGYVSATGDQEPTVVEVNALEGSMAGSQPLPVNSGQVTVTMDRALATLMVTPSATAPP
ncbi:MAG: hypothetical protein DHS20C11_35400 [Lysobacteraceae bacterium]|nr:MAG: hypothetical protein DHS20C11_35400 [Xanthomonadaceae bacterium]